MADIELVIKISEKAYNALTHTEFDANLVVDEMRKSIVDGTPFPKGCDIQRIIPQRVDVQKWICTVCPNCGRELSTHHGDGYYIIEHKPDFCPNCGQALLWESEG